MDMVRMIVVFLFGFHSVIHGQKAESDSLQKLIQTQIEDTNKINLLNKLAYADIQDSLGLEYAREALQLSEKLKYKPGKALGLKNIGLYYYIKSDYTAAQENWQRALKNYKELGDLAGQSNILNNLGTINYSLGNLSKAMEFYMQSLEASQQAFDTVRMATALNNIGNIYIEKPVTYDLAIDYINRALVLSEKIGDNNNLGLAYMNLGLVYYNKGNDSAAFYNYKKATETLDPKDEMLPHVLNNMGNLYAKKGQDDLALSYYEESFKKGSEIGIKQYMAQASLSIAQHYNKFKNHDKSRFYFEQARDLASTINAGPELRQAYYGLSNAYSAKGDFKQAYRYSNLAINLADSLYKFGADSLQLKYTVGLKEKEIELLLKDKVLQNSEIRRQKIAKNGLIAGLGLVFLIIGILYRDYLNKVKTNKLLDHQKAEIEGLLLNILPAEVATELQQEGNATPKYFEQASVLFTDFKGFTRMADALSPQEVVAALNECFMAFDDIIERNNLEKIKTIGDSYMCAGGIPRADPNHVMNIVRASFEILEFMRGWNKVRAEKGLSSWELRIGIHVGPVVAGVVGKKKYAYDIWGSTVNIASRMESAGEIGQVNISETLYELIKDQYDCSYRGKISAKNIGDIDMYFVNHLKTEVEEVELTKYAS